MDFESDAKMTTTTEDRDKIFEGAFEDIFFVPGQDKGLYLLDEPEWYWRKVKGGNIRGINVCVDADDCERIEKSLKEYKKSKFPYVTEFNALPAVFENATFFRQFIALGGKWLLSGAAGGRFSAAHHVHNRKVLGNNDIQHEMADFFGTFGRGRSEEKISVYFDDIAELDIAIDCRNFHNYYHFVSETLAQLASVSHLAGDRRVNIHAKTHIMSGFVERSIQEVFPNLFDRVSFIGDDPTPVKYDSVLGVFDTKRPILQFSEASVPDQKHYEDFPEIWNLRSGKRADVLTFMHNSYSASIRHLREAAYGALSNVVRTKTASKLWVARKPAGSRDRTPRNVSELETELLRNGFEKVYFEDMTQLEQVAAMRNAKAVATVHGAGMANMIFASPSTHVYELSNAQGLGGRWKGFASLAHVSECSHTTFFADRIPEAQGLSPVSLEGNATDEILAQIDADGNL